jgi:hypothetical protein
MSKVTMHVLATVNAPYRTHVSAHQLAAMIADPKSAEECNVHVFGFFSEVSASAQKQFMAEMGVSMAKAKKVAALLSKQSGYKVTLAA